MSLESSVTELVEEASALIQTFNNKKSEIEQAVNDALADSVKPLENITTWTIGPGGQYETINEALVEAANFSARKRNAGSTNFLNLRLLSGFVMQEQIYISNGLDLSYVSIYSDDDVVPIDCNYLTNKFWNYKSAFTASGRAHLPTLSLLFEMLPDGRTTEHCGVELNYTSSVQFGQGAGVKNAGGIGLYLSSTSSAVGYACNFSGAGVDGLSLNGASYARMEALNVSSATNHGVICSSSFLYAQLVDSSGAGNTGVSALGLSDVLISGGNCRKTEGEDSSSDIVVGGASRIQANTAIGGTNVAINTWTVTGQITQ